MIELAFNILMLYYLIQPYKDAKAASKDGLQPNRAVRAITGNNVDTAYDSIQQQVHLEYEDIVVVEADRNAFGR